jgi:hypothetical protein
MFFTELSTKDNAVYNHFVDMFSLLSAGGNMEEESFRRVVKFLLGFVEKVRDAFMSRKAITNASIRTSMLSNWPRSLRLDLVDARRSDNGTMLRTRWAFCSTRTRRSQSWCQRVTEWFKHRLKLDVEHRCYSRRNDGMSDVKWDVTTIGYRWLIDEWYLDCVFAIDTSVLQ